MCSDTKNRVPWIGLRNTALDAALLVLFISLLRILRGANFAVLFRSRALYQQRARTKHRTRKHSRSSDVFTTGE